MKKKFVHLVGLCILSVAVFTGCGTTDQTTASQYKFGEELAFIMEEEEINLDLPNCSDEIQSEYQSLHKKLSSVELDEIAVGTTSTVNMLSEIGFYPVASVESQSLKKDIQELLYTSGEKKENGILNIGSALSPNVEVLATSGAKVFFISDAFPPSDWEEAMNEVGIEVFRISQSEYTDIFVILQAFKDLNCLDNELINDKMKDMKEDLESVSTLMEKENKGSAALIQMMGQSIYTNGGSSVLGKVVSLAGIENVYQDAENSELNREDLLLKNPEYLFLYGEGLDKEEIEENYNQIFKAEDSGLSQIDAVKKGNYVILGDDDFRFMGSIDFNITKVMRQIAEAYYE